MYKDVKKLKYGKKKMVRFFNPNIYINKRKTSNSPANRQYFDVFAFYRYP